MAQIPPSPGSGQMHAVDYTIHGDDMQFVEVELDPSEAVIAEAGGMMYMDDGIAMETVFGDGVNPAAAQSKLYTWMLSMASIVSPVRKAGPWAIKSPCIVGSALSYP